MTTAQWITVCWLAVFGILVIASTIDHFGFLSELRRVIASALKRNKQQPTNKEQHMSKRYTFVTGYLAGAFIGVLRAMTSTGEGLAAPHTNGSAPISLEVDWRNGPYIMVCGNAGTAMVRSLLDFEIAVREVMAMRPRSADRLNLRENQEPNPTRHEITVFRNGNITVGCQTIEKVDADRISAVVRDQFAPSFTLLLRRGRVTSNGRSVQFGDHNMIMDQLKAIVKLRDDFLSGASEAPSFHLFS